MKELTRGAVIALLGVAICKLCYASGYNDALKFVNDVTEIKKQVKKELSNM